MKYFPHDYQRYCLDRMIQDPALALLLGMGLGKTVITLTAVQDLKYSRFQVNKVLIIAPKKVAELVWIKEAAKWDHTKHLRCVKVMGTAQQRLNALYAAGDVYIINRDNVRWLVDHFRHAWPFDMVVIDELSSFKSPYAKRTKALSLVRAKIRRMVGLTGTPSPNGLLDLWSQIYLLDVGERLGKTFEGFRQRYFDHSEYSYAYTPYPETEKAIWSKISDICVSMKAEDYLELPDCSHHIIPVALDPKALKAYQRMERDMLLETPDGVIDAGSAVILTGKLLQLCNGAVYDGDRQVHEVHACKLEAFLELVEMLHAPALVFYNFKHDLDRLKAALVKTGLRVAVLTGQAEEIAWNRQALDILLAHPASAAYGLNLQDGGNHVIWFGLTWSLELYQQANARLHRQGQTQKVIIHHLTVDGGMDEDVLAALEAKGAIQDRLMNALNVRVERAKAPEGH
jgi:SNF2 family DNA or RNA helicase